MNKPGEKENAKEKSNDLAPRIIYASRTHSQLTQVVAEAEKLRRDCNYNIDSTVLGGRSALCSNPDVSQERDQFALQMACTTARKQKACGWKTRFDDLPVGKYPYGVIDIEELVNYSQRGHVCAYYLSRAKAKMAKVIMMPYKNGFKIN